MSVNKENVLKQFCDVTGADEARSKFFLESSNWQLEVALSSFYEHEANIDDEPAAPSPHELPTQELSDMESPQNSPPSAKKKDKKAKKPNKSNFATLSSLQQDSSSDEEEVPQDGGILQDCMCDKSSCTHKYIKTENGTQDQKIIDDCDLDKLYELEDENDRLTREVDILKAENIRLRKEIEEKEKDPTDTGQAFYAGGSERSGQQIIGPGKGRNDIVTEMFKSVRQLGAVAFKDDNSASRGQPGAFSGVGHRLGQTTSDHEEVSVGNVPPGQIDDVRSVRLRLYREGFTVDSGVLRHYSDPSNTEFLSFIRRGEIPQELSSGGAKVRVSLEDRRHEECPKQMVKAQAFAGKGQMLGSPTPPVLGATQATPAEADRVANERAAQQAVTLNDQQPTTTIQFRLADGSRLTGRFNHSHTVADLRQYLTTAIPTSQLQNFVLMTTFPNAELTDPSITLEQAKLLNSVIVQRVK